MKPSGLLNIFILPVEKSSDKGASTQIFFLVIPFAVQNPYVFRDGSLEVVVKVRLVRIQSIAVVNMLIVDFHLNIGKNGMQIVVYMSNERNWSRFSFLLFLCFPCFISLFDSSLCSFFSCLVL